MKIKLTRGYEAAIDDEDALLPFIKNRKWNAHVTRGGIIYATNEINGKFLYLHRYIIGAKAGEIIDHKNGDTLDCRKSNLRKCTYSQNLANTKLRGGSSRYKGVYEYKANQKWKNPKNKWVAKARLNGKIFHLGYHELEESAAMAYDKKAIELFGEFARLNFPDRVNA